MLNIPEKKLPVSRQGGDLYDCLAARLCGLLVLLCLTVGLRPSRGQSTGAELEPGTIPVVAYVSEVPYQWTGAMGNPLELWARKLSSAWAASYADGGATIANLRPELSWERLEKLSRTGKADAFAIQGYELIERGAAANLEALLVPTKNGKAAMVEFIILRRREAEPFRIAKLEKKKIRVDRGGCGELVNRWLDCEIIPETGDSKREYLAEFYSASSAAEAVLDVYFGRIDACVVSREDYQELLQYNPAGLSGQLEEVRASPPFLKHIIACPAGERRAVRKLALQKSAEDITLTLGHSKYGLAPAKPEDAKTLTVLLNRWRTLTGQAPEGSPDRDQAAAQPAPLPVPERRPR